MRILALDLGIKSLGISVSDSQNIIAIPIENYFFQEMNLQEVIKKTLEQINKYNVSKVLIGFPLKTTGQEASITSWVKEFVEELKKSFKKEIILFDERFTTKRAKDLNFSKINSKEDFKNKKDMASSWVMLHDFLNFN